MVSSKGDARFLHYGSKSCKLYVHTGDFVCKTSLRLNHDDIIYSDTAIDIGTELRTTNPLKEYDSSAYRSEASTVTGLEGSCIQSAGCEIVCLLSVRASRIVVLRCNCSDPT